MRRIVFLLGLILLLPALAEARVYRWVDSNGRVQFTDSPPPAEAQGVTELDAQGLVRKKAEVKASAAEIARQQADKKKEEEQRRRDRALILSFTHPSEIDRVRDGQIDAVNARAQTSKLRLQSAREKLNRLKQQAGALQSRKRPIPADLAQDIAATEAEIAQMQLEQKQQQEEIRLLNEKAEVDKRRLIELMGNRPK